MRINLIKAIPQTYFNPVVILCISIIIILPVIISIIPISASAIEPLSISDENVVYPIGHSLEYIEDNDKNLTINDLFTHKISQQFKPSTANILDLGLTEANIWVRFSIKNTSKETKKWLLEISLAPIGDIEFYIPNNKGGFDVKKTGYLQPINKREKYHRFFVLDMPELTNQTKTFYLRFNSQDAIELPMSIMTQDTFYKNDYLRQYAIGVYYGILLVMILYNLFIYVSLRDMSYLYYVIYFVCLLMVLSYNDGIFYGFDLTEKGFTVKTECFFMAAAPFWWIIFSISFLRTAHYTPTLNRILQLIAIFFALTAILTFFISPYNVQFFIFISILITIPMALISGITCLMRGFRPARFFLLASFIFLAGVVLRILADLSIIRMSFIAMHSMMIGSAIDVTLLSIALADRINIMKSELIENANYILKTEAEIAKTHKLESLAILAGGMAHDLNNILTGLFMKVQLSASIIKIDPDKASGYLSDVKNIFEMVTNILSRLQTFSKGDTLLIKYESLSILLTEAGNLVLSGSNSQCEVTILKELLPVEFDKTQLNQVITNMLINADQAMPNGGKINITAENIEITDNILPPLTKGRYIKITISDNGTGIPKENISKIFDPFFTTKTKGQGLGLAASYSIIKKHKGHIEVKSEFGHGASFYIYLPVSQSEQKEIEDKLILDESLLLGKSIMIMDDNETLLEGITAFLSKKGCIVDAARNGDEAIALYKKRHKSEEPYDLLIIDVTISGGMGGIAAIKQLKEIDPKVMAIVSSGYSEIPVMSNFRQYGFVAALPKPYTLEELIYVLNKSLESR